MNVHTEFALDQAQVALVGTVEVQDCFVVVEDEGLSATDLLVGQCGGLSEGCQRRRQRGLYSAVLRFSGAPIQRLAQRLAQRSGAPRGQELAWSLLGPSAHLSVVGYTRNEIPLRLSNLMAFDATAQGNWGCLPELYPDALALVLEGRIALAPFVEIRPMAEIQTALEEVRDHRIARRPVLVP